MTRRGIDRLGELFDEHRTATTTADKAQSYEETTRRMVEKVEDDVRSLRRRLDALIFMVLSAIFAEMISRFFGG